MMKKVYYAHSMGIYGTIQETRDIETLEKMDFEVINPNHKVTSKKFLDKLKAGEEYEKAFDDVFGQLVRESDILAFRAQLDGLVGAGVLLEIEEAKKHNKPIIELPSALYKRKATVEQTKEFLKEIGER